MSARLVSAVPAWYEVSGTTGSPSLTSSSSTVPAIGARMIDSTTRLLALDAALLDEGELLGGEPQADPRVLDLLVGLVPVLGREDPLLAGASRERSYFFWAWSKMLRAISTSRRASVSSSGVGSGRISNSGSPARTWSPTSRK